MRASAPRKKRRRRKTDAESHEVLLWLLLFNSDMNGLFRLVTDVIEITAVTEIGARKQGFVPHCSVSIFNLSLSSPD